MSKACGLIAASIALIGIQVDKVVQDSSSSDHYFAGNKKKIQWVFVGMGRVDLLGPELKDHKISYGVVPWLLIPPRDSKRMLTSDLTNKDWGAIAVDRDLYVQARAVIETHVSKHEALLAAYSEHPQNWFPAPPDSDLIDNYRKHKTVLDAIAKMALHDRMLIRVGADWTNPHNPGSIGISQQRVANYRALLEAANVPEGFSANESGPCNLMYWGFGSVGNDDHDKGYAYLLKPPKHLQKTLDGYEPGGRKRSTVFRHLDGHWYLYYDFIPD